MGVLLIGENPKAGMDFCEIEIEVGFATLSVQKSAHERDERDERNERDERDERNERTQKQSTHPQEHHKQTWRM